MAAVSDLIYLSRLDIRFSTDSCVTYQTVARSRSTPDQRRAKEEQEWTRQEELGDGGYGIVYLEECTQGSQQGSLRAVKRFKKLVNGAYNRELEAAALFSHPKYEDHFVKSFGWYESHDRLYLTMEYLPLGDLQNYVGSPMPESNSRLIISQILEGLDHMHERHFTHRDLKPANILVASVGPDWWVKLADFGISKRAQQGLTYLHTQVYTPGFAAPEVVLLHMLNDDADDAGGPAVYTNAVDIWSAGAVAHVVLTGKVVLQHPTQLRKYYQSKIEFPTQQLDEISVDASCRDLVTKLMAPNAIDRPTAQWALSHPWLGHGVSQSDTQPSNADESQSSTINLNNLSTKIRVDTKQTKASATWKTSQSDDNPTIHTASRQLAMNATPAVTLISRPSNVEEHAAAPIIHSLCRKAAHTQTILLIEFRRDDNHLVSVGKDGKLALWDLHSNLGGSQTESNSNFQAKWKANVNASAHTWISPDGSAGLTIGDDSKIEYISITKDACSVFKTEDKSTLIWNPIYAPHTACTAWIGDERRLRLHSKYKPGVIGRRPSAQAAAFASDGRTIIIFTSALPVCVEALDSTPPPSHDTTGYYWDWEHPRPTLSYDNQYVWQTPTRPVSTLSGADHFVWPKNWPSEPDADLIRKVECSKGVKGPVVMVLFGQEPWLGVYQTAWKSEIKLAGNTHLHDAAFSPDGTLLAGIGPISDAVLENGQRVGGSIRIWRALDGSLLREELVDRQDFSGHFWAVRFSPDAAFLAISGWNIVALAPMASLLRDKGRALKWIVCDREQDIPSRSRASDRFSFSADSKIFAWAVGCDIRYINLDNCR